MSVIDKSCVSLSGNGKSGCVDGLLKTAQFYEPSGIALNSARQILYVADTNNHVIRLIDLVAGVVSTLSLGNLVDDKLEGRDGAFNVKVGNTCSLLIEIQSSQSVKLDDTSVWEIVIPSQSSFCVSAPEKKGKMSLDGNSMLQLVYSRNASNTTGTQAFIHLYLQYCVGGMCKISQEYFSVAFQFEDTCTQFEQSLYISI